MARACVSVTNASIESSFSEAAKDCLGRVAYKVKVEDMAMGSGFRLQR